MNVESYPCPIYITLNINTNYSLYISKLRKSFKCFVPQRYHEPTIIKSIVNRPFINKLQLRIRNALKRFTRTPGT